MQNQDCYTPTIVRSVFQSPKSSMPEIFDENKDPRSIKAVKCEEETQNTFYQTVEIFTPQKNTFPLKLEPTTHIFGDHSPFKSVALIPVESHINALEAASCTPIPKSKFSKDVDCKVKRAIVPRTPLPTKKCYGVVVYSRAKAQRQKSQAIRSLFRSSRALPRETSPPKHVLASYENDASSVSPFKPSPSFLISNKDSNVASIHKIPSLQSESSIDIPPPTPLQKIPTSVIFSKTYLKESSPLLPSYQSSNSIQASILDVSILKQRSFVAPKMESSDSSLASSSFPIASSIGIPSSFPPSVITFDRSFYRRTTVRTRTSARHAAKASLPSNTRVSGILQNIVSLSSSSPSPQFLTVAVDLEKEGIAPPCDARKTSDFTHQQTRTSKRRRTATFGGGQNSTSQNSSSSTSPFADESDSSGQDGTDSGSKIARGLACRLEVEGDGDVILESASGSKKGSRMLTSVKNENGLKALEVQVSKDISSFTLIVGRDKSFCDISVMDVNREFLVSRRHATVSVWKGNNGWHAIIIDNASTSGTYVNRKRILSAELKDGDLVSLGALMKPQEKDDKIQMTIPKIGDTVEDVNHLPCSVRVRLPSTGKM
eukprot:GDKJ01043101.1.p1 GENE.GDKJ01043101.1~~GDKJ01043101.1.p1  ORF type:complete len:600 (-),score=93.31 GDKJ01043101.1:59-1858(-)